VQGRGHEISTAIVTVGTATGDGWKDEASEVRKVFAQVRTIPQRDRSEIGIEIAIPW
jgi:hypothetical protein